MNQLNSLIVEGNVTRVLASRETGQGFKVCTIPIAINRYYKNSSGEATKEVSYFDVETFGKLADQCERQLEIGRGVRVVGRLKQSRWKNEAGKAFSKVSIIAEHIEFKPRKKPEDAEAEGSGVPEFSFEEAPEATTAAF